MRTLVLAGDYPWPEDRGSRIRLLTILRGLRRVSAVDLCSIISQSRTDIDPPEPSLGLERTTCIGYDNRPASGLSRVRAAARLGIPLEIPVADRDRVRQEVSAFAEGPYDLVWYFRVRPWALAGEHPAGFSVLDLDDLEDHKIRIRLEQEATRPRSQLERAKAMVARAVSKDEARRWARLQRRASEGMAATIVCSELDADRARSSGITRVEVLPNSVRPADPRPPSRRGERAPTLLFQGLLSYPANADAARYLVNEVLPALRSLVPEACVRLVGVAPTAVQALHDPPRTTVVGHVVSMAPELERADLVVVPLRFGSGTRIKIIEAFANRIPVVSTSLGAEGLGAVDGRHLLLGDTADAMAAACARILGDDELRMHLVDSAHTLFVEQFSSDAAELRVAQLVTRLHDQNAVVRHGT
jgi:glycosyltransferase involved in cell wall biosynthesis